MAVIICSATTGAEEAGVEGRLCAIMQIWWFVLLFKVLVLL